MSASMNTPRPASVGRAMNNRFYVSCYQNPAFVVTDAMKWEHKAEPKVLDTYGEAVEVAEKMDGVGFWPVVQVVRSNRP